MDSVLTLYDGKRNQVAENDDWNDPLEAILAHNSDSRILYTFPAAGDYYLRLRDIQGKGGEEYAYRLVLDVPHPDFTLRVAPDNPRLGVGDTAAITVAAVRHDDFAGEIKLAVEGLPAGFTASEALIAAGQNEGRLTITSPAGATPGITLARDHRNGDDRQGHSNAQGGVGGIADAGLRVHARAADAGSSSWR